MSSCPNRDRAVEMRRRGVPAAGIARELGISRERVYQFLRPLGMARDAPEDKAARLAVTIRRLRRQGMSKDQVSRTVGSFKAVDIVLGPCDASETIRKRVEAKHVDSRHGRLTILAVSPDSPRRCLCRCDCGVEKVFVLGNVTRHLSRSCGCLLKEWWERNQA